MTIRTGFIALLLIASPLLADDPAATIREGTALYDAGDYNGAIAKFRSVLATDPSNAVATYELGLTYFANGDYTQCKSTMEPPSAGRGPLQAAMLTVLANCFDMTDEPDRALDTYRKGLRISPDNDQLLYNFGVALMSRGRGDEARATLKKDVAFYPQHASAHYALATVFQQQNFRTPALLEYLRFLALEPYSARAKDAATRVSAILGQGVEDKDGGNINITVDAKPRKGEGDYSAAEMMLAIVAAGRTLPDKKDLTEFDLRREEIGTVLAIITEMGAKGRDHTAKLNVPFFIELSKRKLIDTFAGLAFTSLQLPGTREWTEKNQAAIETYTSFIKGLK